MQTIKNLGMEVEIRNIWEDSTHENDLVNATKRSTVPVLYYEDEQGEAVWMPESRDIIAFLTEQSNP